MKVFLQDLDLTNFAALALAYTQSTIDVRDADSEVAPEYYQVIGSCTSEGFNKPKHVHQMFRPSTSRDDILLELLTCDIIVCDVFTDNAEWFMNELYRQRENFETEKIFVGVSNVLTWTRTVPDLDDAEVPIAENEYKRRRAHLDYRPQIAIEREIMRLGKEEKLKSYIVCSGLVYHGGESIFHYMFKQAWTGLDVICYGDGDNILPIIHLDALCSSIINTAQIKPVSRYVLAVDSAKSSMFELCQAVSTACGTGVVNKVPFESCLLDPSVKKIQFELLKINLRLSSGIIKDFPSPPKFDNGFVENIAFLVKEYKKSHGFSPIKVVLYGAPGIGKSGFADFISKHYGVSVIQPYDLAISTLADYESRVGSEDSEQIETLLGQIKEAMVANNNEIPVEYIIGFVKQMMQSKSCINQGYILDGCTFNAETMTKLFTTENEEKEEVLENPELVISFEASDSYLKQKTMEMSESDLASKYASETEYLRKLAMFRENDVPDVCVLNYFDENEVPVKNFDVENGDVKQFILKTIGSTRNYGPSREEIQRLENEIRDIKIAQDKLFESAEKEKTEDEIQRKKNQESEWQQKIREIKQQEDEVLEAHAAPLRTYLMKYVMPVLSSGLAEVCKIRPEDPIDYLAEYLFKAHSSSEDTQ